MPPTSSATLLLVVENDDDAQLQRDWLERAGYRVRLANGLKEVEQACHADKFDMILVADVVEPRMKKAIGMMIRHFLPNAPILQMGRTRPDLDGDCFVTSGSREDVLRSVSRILNRDDIPPAAL
jgi:CheY-like chemotaxis protein